MTADTGHMSKRRGASVVGVVIAGVLFLAGCMTAEETSAFDLINADRAANGRAALAANDDSIAKAQTWALNLANASGGVCNSSTIPHSTLTDGAPAGWKKLGENIGCHYTTGDIASAVAPIEADMLASPSHFAILTDPAYTHGGVGMAAVPRAGFPSQLAVFEVQEFAKL